MKRQGNWRERHHVGKGDKLFKSAMASLVPEERQFQAEERGRRQERLSFFFSPS